MSKRYYINNIDSYLGQALYRQLYKPEEEESDVVIIGSKTDPLNTEKLPGTKKILKRAKPKLFRKYLTESDTIIYDLHFGDLDDIEFAIEAFKNKGPIEEPKTLILISTVLVWGNTERKVKPPEEKPEGEGEEGEGGEGAEGEEKKSEAEKPNESAVEEEEQPSGSQKEQNEEGEEPKPEGEEGQVAENVEIPEEEEEEEIPVEYVPFKEADYLNRQPYEKYERLKRLEDAFLNLNIENVRTFVICAGVLYGKGEVALKEALKAAWLQSPRQLPYVGEGENLIPTIHVDDLAKFVLKVADSPPEELKYIFAIDNTQDRRQKNIMQSISEYMGTGEVVSLPEIDGRIIQKEHEDVFTINLDMVPSALLVDEENPPDFEWTAEKGIPGNMNKISQEFCQAERLKPIKIMIKGDPVSRKTEFCKMIAEHYNIPVIQIKGILEDAEHIKGELGQDFQEEKEKILEYLKENKETPLNETLKVFYRLVRWRLRQNDCRNRGFVIDDFPNHLEEVLHIFFPKFEKKLKRIRPKPKKTKKKGKQNAEENGEEQAEKKEEAPEDEDEQRSEAKEEAESGNGDPKDEEEEEEEEAEEENPEEENAEANEEEEEEEDGEGPPRLEPYFPETLIYIKRHPNTKPPSAEVLAKFNEYEASTKLYDFFTERNIDIYIFDPTNKNDDFEYFESLRIFIEKEGRPNNYLQTEEVLASLHHDYYKNKHQVAVEKHTQEKEEAALNEFNEQERRRQIAKNELEFLKDSEVPDPNVKNMPFRNYLMKFITPILGEGLLQISEVLPEDPVDFLAEYLYRKSFELQSKHSEE